MSTCNIICKIINEAFSEPFMPAGFVEAKNRSEVYDKPAISLHIGARDVTFALDGEWIGQGTDLRVDASTESSNATSKDLSESRSWFTADTHFGHQRTLELFKRPFSSVAEMDWEIVRKWNTVIRNDDTVYHLGDFGNPEMIKHLKGNKIIVLPGNYDDSIVVSALRQDKRVEFIKNGSTARLSDSFFKLIHEPEKAITKADFYLFGHIHQLQMVKLNGLNVGVDCHNFYPISTEDILFFHNAIINHYDDNVFLGQLGK